MQNIISSSARLSFERYSRLAYTARDTVAALAGSLKLDQLLIYMLDLHKGWAGLQVEVKGAAAFNDCQFKQ